MSADAVTGSQASLGRFRVERVEECLDDGEGAFLIFLQRHGSTPRISSVRSCALPRDADCPSASEKQVNLKPSVERFTQSCPARAVRGKIHVGKFRKQPFNLSPFQLIGKARRAQSAQERFGNNGFLNRGKGWPVGGNGVLQRIFWKRGSIELHPSRFVFGTRIVHR